MKLARLSLGLLILVAMMIVPNAFGLRQHQVGPCGEGGYGIWCSNGSSTCCYGDLGYCLGYCANYCGGPCVYNGAS